MNQRKFAIKNQKGWHRPLSHGGHFVSLVSAETKGLPHDKGPIEAFYGCGGVGVGEREGASWLAPNTRFPCALSVMEQSAN